MATDENPAWSVPSCPKCGTDDVYTRVFKWYIDPETEKVIIRRTGHCRKCSHEWRGKWVYENEMAFLRAMQDEQMRRMVP